MYKVNIQFKQPVNNVDSVEFHSTELPSRTDGDFYVFQHIVDRPKTTVLLAMDIIAEMAFAEVHDGPA